MHIVWRITSSLPQHLTFSSDVVILDDKFGSIVKAIIWGRTVYDNIRMFLQFQLTVNVVALLLVFIGAVAGFGQPLNAVMMLWVSKKMKLIWEDKKGGRKWEEWRMAICYEMRGRWRGRGRDDWNVWMSNGTLQGKGEGGIWEKRYWTVRWKEGWEGGSKRRHNVISWSIHLHIVQIDYCSMI